MAYTGQIYYNEAPITIEEAVTLNLITVDGNDDIWLSQDSMHAVNIQGDLHLTG